MEADGGGRGGGGGGGWRTEAEEEAEDGGGGDGGGGAPRGSALWASPGVWAGPPPWGRRRGAAGARSCPGVTPRTAARPRRLVSLASAGRRHWGCGEARPSGGGARGARSAWPRPAGRAWGLQSRPPGRGPAGPTLLRACQAPACRGRSPDSRAERPRALRAPTAAGAAADARAPALPPRFRRTPGPVAPRALRCGKPRQRRGGPQTAGRPRPGSLERRGPGFTLPSVRNGGRWPQARGNPRKSTLCAQIRVLGVRRPERHKANGRGRRRPSPPGTGPVTAAGAGPSPPPSPPSLRHRAEPVGPQSAPVPRPGVGRSSGPTRPRCAALSAESHTHPRKRWLSRAARSSWGPAPSPPASPTPDGSLRLPCCTQALPEAPSPSPSSSGFQAEDRARRGDCDAPRSRRGRGPRPEPREGARRATHEETNDGAGEGGARRRLQPGPPENEVRFDLVPFHRKTIQGKGSCHRPFWFRRRRAAGKLCGLPQPRAPWGKLCPQGEAVEGTPAGTDPTQSCTDARPRPLPRTRSCPATARAPQVPKSPGGRGLRAPPGPQVVAGPSPLQVPRWSRLRPPPGPQVSPAPQPCCAPLPSSTLLQKPPGPGGLGGGRGGRARGQREAGRSLRWGRGVGDSGLVHTGPSWSPSAPHAAGFRGGPTGDPREVPRAGLRDGPPPPEERSAGARDALRSGPRGGLRRRGPGTGTGTGTGTVPPQPGEPLGAENCAGLNVVFILTAKGLKHHLGTAAETWEGAGAGRGGLPACPSASAGRSASAASLQAAPERAGDMGSLEAQLLRHQVRVQAVQAAGGAGAGGAGAGAGGAAHRPASGRWEAEARPAPDSCPGAPQPRSGADLTRKYCSENRSLTRLPRSPDKKEIVVTTEG
uniref:basic proline-rich protein-like n=1 Tax=Nyctereutes procyonoides TaxID=34880 RepID=UPI002443F4FA|nr:basic proline-rich protein-like [Nyctereutes procyonoides]